MPQYLVAIQRPNDYDPGLEDDAMRRDVEALNNEMRAAGAQIFAGGLQLPPQAKSLRQRSDGSVIVTDGPYLEAKEFVGGFWLLQAADLNEALDWGRKAALACRAGVEVRAFN